MSDSTLYEEVLRRIASDTTSLPELKPPRRSASVVLWRGRDTELEVFWLKRSPNLRFMGGFHAFPGGGISRRDRHLDLRGRPHGVDEAPRDAALPVAVIDDIDELEPILTEGLVACALRELFEETGVLPSSRLSTARGDSGLIGQLDGGRRRLLARQTEFSSLVQELSLDLRAEDLIYAGRWLTPPLGPVRFDNRFFLLAWPRERLVQPVVIPGEAESGEWIRPREGLDRWQAGELVTAPPILHILRVLAEDGPRAGLGRLREPAEMNLGPFRRIEFRPGVLLFPLKTPTLPPASFTNCYVLGTREVVLIDPGSPYEEEIDRLHHAVTALARSGGRVVSAIWLTHHHPDHIGGVARLREALGVPVCAHEQTAERLQGEGVSIDRHLVDGQRWVLDGEPPFPVRVAHTPGHARGHLCFYDERFGSLLAGDLVAGFGTIVIDPPEGNMAEYLESLQQMRALRPRALFPAHGPPTVSAVGKLDEYLRHRWWREERVERAWRAGHRRPQEMLSHVYDDLPALAEPLAERQIVAHLEHLRATGHLEE